MCHRSLAIRDLAALEAKTLFTLEVCRGEQVLNSLGTILQRGCDVKHYWSDWKPQALSSQTHVHTLVLVRYTKEQF